MSSLRSLVIVTDAGPTTPAVGPTAVVLGLPLVRRVALAGARAGFQCIRVTAAIGSAARRERLCEALAGTAAFPFEPQQPLTGNRLVVLAGAVLADTKQLTALAEMPLAGGVAVDGEAIAVIDLVADRRREEAALALNAPDPFARIAAIAGAEPRALAGAFGLVLAGPEDVAAAERRLLKGLIKDSEGFMSRRLERPISLAITRRLCRTTVTPNTMTLISVGIGLSSAPFFLSSEPGDQSVGALLLLAHSIVDGCDGELARLKFQESRLGGILDFWGDNVVHVAVFAAMMVGAARSPAAQASATVWPYLAGASTVISTALIAAFVYLWTMRPKRGTGPMFTSVTGSRSSLLSKVLDAVSRRDFIYGIVALAVFGKASWFLIVAGVGAPIFLVLLAVAAAAETSRA